MQGCERDSICNVGNNWRGEGGVVWQGVLRRSEWVKKVIGL